MIKAFNYNSNKKEALKLFFSLKKFDSVSVDNIIDCII